MVSARRAADGDLELKVPKRLALRVDEKAGAQAQRLSASIIGGGRGETIIRDIAGQVQANQRGSTITIADVGSLRLTTVSAGEVKVSDVRGDATLNFTGGEVRPEKLAGAVEVDSRNAELRFEEMEAAGRCASRDRRRDRPGRRAVRRASTAARRGARRPGARRAARDLRRRRSDRGDAADGGMKIDAVASDGRIYPR